MTVCSINEQVKKDVRSFSFGKDCRYCSKEAVKHCINPAIPNIHSNWISNSILGMQRPHKKSHFEHCETPLVDSFKNLGITAIINCTEIGEHPDCGDGILDSIGLSYDPNDFVKEGIEYHHYGWKDMTTPSIELMLKIVNVGKTIIEKGGKICVHCHAGFGRTGIVIACILISIENITAEEAIARVRSTRQRSISIKLQEDYVYEYYEKVKKNKI